MGVPDIAGLMAPQVRLDLARYKRLMSSPLWGFVTQVVIETRSYKKGRQLAALLLSFTRQNRDALTDEERRSNLIRIHLFTLTLLDKLDEWEEYVKTWEKVATNGDLVERV